MHDRVKTTQRSGTEGRQMRIGPFILFAHPRSGSTTLAEVFSLHPDLTVLMEPFHEEFHLWFPGQPNYLERVKDADSLDAQLHEIFSTHHGIKITNWPLPFELYAHMLADPRWKIVFLRRKNILKASLSCAIAHRTGAWQRRDLRHDPAQSYDGLGAIPEAEVIEWIEAVQRDMARYAAILDARPPRTVCRVTYEDLFGRDAAQQETLDGLYDFLEVRRFRSREIDDLLDRCRNRMNSVETYRFIENYREIDRIGVQRGFGSLFTD